MKTRIPIILLLVISVAGLLFFFQNRNNAAITPEENSTTTTGQDAPLSSVVAQGLKVPWSMVFLPNKSMLVTEREGQVRLIDTDGTLQSSPIATIADVKQAGEGGLHGITIHPNFEINNFVYLYYTYAKDGNQTLNRVSRYTFNNNTLTDAKTIVDAIPGAQFHDGGRIKFGPDNFLYITTGDAQEPSLAQDKNSLAGKILRVTDTGEPAPENSFNTRIYSYGHRNPQGIAWDENGTLYETEHGRSGVLSGLDELNHIETGKNYGWPTIEGDKKHDGMITPLLHSGGTTTWAPGGLAYLNSKLYFTGLRGEALYEVSVNGNTAELKEHLKGEFGRIRDVIVGPDDMLYIATSNRDSRGNPKENDDQILRINPNKL